MSSPNSIAQMSGAEVAFRSTIILPGSPCRLWLAPREKCDSSYSKGHQHQDTNPPRRIMRLPLVAMVNAVKS